MKCIHSFGGILGHMVYIREGAITAPAVPDLYVDVQIQRRLSGRMAASDMPETSLIPL